MWRMNRGLVVWGRVAECGVALSIALMTFYSEFLLGQNPSFYVCCVWEAQIPCNIGAHTHTQHTQQHTQVNTPTQKINAKSHYIKYVQYTKTQTHTHTTALTKAIKA